MWVGSDGLVLQITGGLRGTSMVLEGEGLGQGGQRSKQRAAWTPQPTAACGSSGSNRPMAAATWTVAFDGWYRRKP